MTTQERVTEVRALRMVTEVIEDCPCPAPFEWKQSEGLPPTAPILDEEFIKKYRIHLVAHGEEYLPEKLAPGAMDYYAIPRAMGMCRPLPRTPGISTSELMKRMKDRVTEKDRIDAAAPMDTSSSSPSKAAPPAEAKPVEAKTKESEATPKAEEASGASAEEVPKLTKSGSRKQPSRSAKKAPRVD